MKQQAFIYLTVGNYRSAVYRSQVIGTCEYLRDELRLSLKLVTLTSARSVIRARNWLTEAYSDSGALPLLAGNDDSRLNLMILGAFFRRWKRPVVIARGVRPTQLALLLRDRGAVETVCYDGRGATAAETAEYNESADGARRDRSMRLERDAVLRSDFRLAVSRQLVCYWRDEYGYEDDNYEVIPCTLKPDGESTLEAVHLGRERVRRELGISRGETVLAYAGSNRAWQSLEQVGELLRQWMEIRGDISVLFLAPQHPATDALMESFPGRVYRLFVAPKEVRAYLSAADFGLLLREPSVTNRVAAPTKFVEYLAAGLAVLVSPGIGDYSEFVAVHDVGFVISSSGFDVTRLGVRNDRERKRTIMLAHRHFVRASYRREYERMRDVLLRRAG